MVLLTLLALLVGCSGPGDQERNCEIVPGTIQPVTDRILLAQCGDGSICVGACGGTQDSGNTTDSNNPDNSDRSTTIVNPTPVPRRR